MKIRKIIIFCCFLSAVVFAGSWVGLSRAIEYPEPEGWVSDQAGIIDSASREKIVFLIQELEQKTSAEIAVVTIGNLSGETVEDYAVKLFEKWGIGKKDKNNGVLILAAAEDRKARIEVGYGLEGILPDGLCGEVLDTYLIPAFRKGEYGQGLLLAASAVASIIAKDAGAELTGRVALPPVSEKHGFASGLLKLIIFVFMIIIFIRHPFLFLLFLGMGGGRGGGGGGGFGGGFGGFGGGSSGGGGSSRGW